MFSFLTEVQIYLCLGAGSFLAGVIFSTKVKDWMKGIPAQARVALNNVEARALADVRHAQAEALARIPGAVPVKTPLPPSAQPLPPSERPPVAASAPAPVAVASAAAPVSVELPDKVA